MKVLLGFVPLVLLLAFLMFAVTSASRAAKRENRQVTRRSDLRKAEKAAEVAHRQAIEYRHFVDDLRQEVWDYHDASPLGTIILGRIRDFTRAQENNDTREIG